MAEEERPVWWVAGMVMLVIAGFGWAFMAAGYAHGTQGWRNEGIAAGKAAPRLHGAHQRAWSDFLLNALRQIPNCVSVFSYSFQNQIWLPILIGVLELLAVAGGFGMQHVERALNTPRGRR